MAKRKTPLIEVNENDFNIYIDLNCVLVLTCEFVCLMAEV
jgi:hypothetical protein